MYKILFYFIFPIILLSNNKIDNKIILNKKILQAKINDKEKTNIAIKKLANKIQIEENKYTKINENLKKISNLLLINKAKLTSTQEKVNLLEKQSLSLKNISKETENKIVNSIIENYSLSISKNILNKESINDIINKEKYNILLDSSKDKILKSNVKYFKLQNQQKNNYNQINKLKEYIKLQNLQKEKYNLLKQKQKKSLYNLKSNYKLYKNKLKQIILKQNKINKLLDNLDILKLKELRKEKLKALKASLKKKTKTSNRKDKLKKLNFTSKKSKKTKKVIKIKEKAKFKDEIDLNVKKYGSSMNGIKLSMYNGIKTIAPLKKYKIVKKFGKYYDPIYKIELFNESISLKSSIKNAKVHSVLRGKVVYAKNDASTLGSVVIVKHSKGLHTVYSQLSNIPKSLKVGKWIPKGYVVGRVKDTLIFQATKNSRYINPVKLFK